MLLVQDSCPDRPVFSVGLDLLMDMGLENLQFCTLPNGWKFNGGLDYTVSPRTKALFAGSPMAVDDDGVARITLPEEPVKMKPDMSYYLDKVEPGPVCYFT